LAHFDTSTSSVHRKLSASQAQCIASSVQASLLRQAQHIAVHSVITFAN